MQVNPGELNKKIKVYSLSKTTDGEGFPLNVETLVCETWASMNNVSGSEVIKSEADFSETKTRFLVRYNSLITRKMIIKFKEMIWDIEYINDYKYSNAYMEIIAMKRELV